MAKIEICSKLAAAAAQYVANDDVRLYTNGVYFQRHRTNGVMAIATNGYFLFAGYDPGAFMDDELWPGVIIKLPTALVGACKKKSSNVLKLEVDGADSAAQIDNSGFIGVKLIKGRFPTWRSVVKRPSRDLKAISANGKYLATVGRTGLILGKSVTMTLGTSGDGGRTAPLYIRFDETIPGQGGPSSTRAFVILMPMRGDKDPGALPRWAGIRLPKKGGGDDG